MSDIKIVPGLNRELVKFIAMSKDAKVFMVKHFEIVDLSVSVPLEHKEELKGVLKEAGLSIEGE